jgi:serine/threonine protein kinase
LTETNMGKAINDADRENDFARALEQLHEQLIGKDQKNALHNRGTNSHDGRMQSAAEILQLLEQKAARDSRRAMETIADPSTKWSVNRDHEEVVAPDTLERILPDLESLGRFRIIEQIGRGGFGIVVRAYDPELNREVAIKIPRLETALSKESRIRFEREARAAAALNHPNIVTVYETGWHDGICYIVSELVDGENLADYLARGTRLSPDESAKLIASLADAVEHSHQRGVLHRDLKPSNILIRNENGKTTALISDFGLASIVEDQDFTQTGAAVGTPAYMSPEQAKGIKEQIGPATDVYGLGAIFYQLLSGQAPFAELTAFELLRAVSEKDPVHPSSINKKIPRDLEAICTKCLAKNPKARYASAVELQADLQRYLDGAPIVARPITRWHRAGRWMARNRMVSGLALSLFMALSIGLLSMIALWQRAEYNRGLAVENQNRFSKKSEELAEALNEVSSLWKKSETNRKLAVNNQNRYLEKADQLTEAVNRLFVTLANNPEVQRASADALRRALLDEAKLFQASFVSESPEDPETKLEYARLLKSLAEINLLLGDLENGASLSQESIEHYLEIEGQINLREGEVAGAMLLLGRCKTKNGEFEAANKSFDDALERLASRMQGNGDPTASSELIATYASTLAQKAYSLLHQDKLKESHELAATAITVWKSLSFTDQPDSASGLFRYMDRAISHAIYAETLRLKRDHEGALQACQTAINDFELARHLYCQGEQCDFELAKVYRTLGLIKALDGKFDQAIVEYESAIDMLEQLTAQHPLMEGYAGMLASTRYSLCASLMEANRLSDAKLQIQKNIAEKLAALDQFSELKAATYSYLGDSYNLQYIIELRLNEASLDDRKQIILNAMDAFEQSLSLNPGWSRPRMALARCRANYGNLLYSGNQLDDALAEFELSLADLNQLILAQPDWSEAIDAYFTTSINLIVLRRDQQRFDKAIEIVDGLANRFPDHPRTGNLAIAKARLLVSDGRVDDAYNNLINAIDRWASTTDLFIQAAEQGVGISLMEEIHGEDESITKFEDLAIEVLKKGFAASEDKPAFLARVNASEKLAELITRRNVELQ